MESKIPYENTPEGIVWAKLIQEFPNLIRWCETEDSKLLAYNIINLDDGKSHKFDLLMLPNDAKIVGRAIDLLIENGYPTIDVYEKE